MLDKLKDIIKADIAKKNANKNARDYFYNKSNNKEEIIKVGDEIKVKSKKSIININYLKQLITQKIDYILAKPLSTNNDFFNWNEVFTKMVKNASLDIISWMHFYVNNNKLNYIIVEDSEIIPFFNNTGDLQSLIRYFKIEDFYSIEVWTPMSVQYFKLRDDLLTKLESKPHYQDIYLYNNEIEKVEDKMFTEIPFIPLFNNRNMEDDAEDIYTLLDMHTAITTGFIENINNFQEAIMKLKNFSGNADDLKEAMKLMKELKAVGLPENGDLEPVTVEIPVEARQVILELITNAIYSLGRGVDVDKLIGAGQLTNVYIKSRYQALDFKASDTILQCNIFYKKVIDFINDNQNANLDNTLQFNKTMIINEAEQIETCIKAIALTDEGILSKETLMQNIPWVSNIEEEILKIEKQSSTSDVNEEI